MSIYLDNQSTTPVDHRVYEAMLPYLQHICANPHTTTYRSAITAARAVEKSRAEIATAIGANANEIFFTSGATEANNIAIQGVSLGPLNRNRRKVVTQATEHSSVLEPVRSLDERGLIPTVVGVRKDGIVNSDHLARVVDKHTVLVSIMAVNNETGVIQPSREVADICHQNGAIYHIDCAQALGKIPLDVNELGADLASISGHKIYGPKGIGALYITRRIQSKVKPIYLGGGQEGGIRPGTLPVPLCVGMGVAARIAAEEQEAYSHRISEMTAVLKQAFVDVYDDIRFNGTAERVAPGCLSMTFGNHRANALLESWPDLEVSTGSACESSKTRMSHVLKAMHLTKAMADSTVRIALGRFTTEEDIELVIKQLHRSSL